MKFVCSTKQMLDPQGGNESHVNISLVSSPEPTHSISLRLPVSEAGDYDVGVRYDMHLTKEVE